MKKVINLFTIYALFISSFSSLAIYAQDQAPLASNISAQDLADKNLDENQEIQKDEVKLGEGTSQRCQASIDPSLDRLEAESKFNDQMAKLNFDNQSKLFSDVKTAGGALNASIDVMATSTDGILAANQNARNLTSLNETDLAKLEKMAEEVKSLNNQHDRLQADISKLKGTCTAGNICPDGVVDKLNEKKARLNLVDVKLTSLALDHNNQITGKITKAQAAQGNATSDASKAAIKDANAKGKLAETKMQELRETISSGTGEVNKTLELAMARLDEVLLAQKNNADFEMFELARGPINEDNSTNTQGDKITLSNLEVMSTATAAINLLRCQDLSESQSRSYPLFRAAAATYIASLINDTSNQFDNSGGCILKCIPMKEIAADKELPAGNRKYPELDLKDFADIEPNCKTAQSEEVDDGVYINSANADDDKNEQLKSAERAMNLHLGMAKAFNAKLANTGIDLNISRTSNGENAARIEIDGTETKSGALAMFEAAHAAALMEVTTREELVSAAEAELERAEAWEEESSMMIQIFAAIVALYTAYKVYNCGLAAIPLTGVPFKPICAAWGVALIAALGVLAFWQSDNEKAQEDVEKWEGELAKARLHGLMKCNFPGDSSKIGDMTTPEKFPLIYGLHVIEPLVAYQAPMTPIDGFKEDMKRYAFMANDKMSFLQNFLFSKSYAVSSSEDFTQELGLNSLSGGFRSYMKMRLGAWKLQTNNSAKLVDLKPASIDISALNPANATQENLFDFIRLNNSVYNNEPIRKAGFPLPETRAIYIKAVIDMIRHNIELNKDGLQSAETNLDAYRRIVNKMRRVFDLDTVGNEDDASKAASNKGSCMKNINGFMQVDRECECKKTKSCYEFKSLKFADFKLDPIKSTSELSIKKANALNDGNIEKSTLVDGQLKKSKDAVKEVILTQSRRLYKNNKNDSLKNKDSKKSGGKNKFQNKGKRLRGKSATSNSGKSTTDSNNITSGLVNNFTVDPSVNKDRNAFLKSLEERRRKLRERLKNNSYNPSGKSGLNLGGYNKNGPSTDYATMDSYNFKRNDNFKKDTSKKDGGSNPSENFYSMHAVTNKNALDGTQIYEDSSLSLFKIISKRYREASDRIEKIRE